MTDTDGMDITVRSVDASELSQDAVLALYGAVGWTAYTHNPELLMSALAGSSRVVAAYADEGPQHDLLGLARVISDGATIAYVQDILVHPTAQRTGLGSRLVRAALEPYEHVRQKMLLTDDEEGQRKFYEALGFMHVTDAEKLRAFVRFD